MEKIKLILNPVAGRGFSAKAETEICQYLKEEGLDFDLVRTERKWHAAELAEQAVRDGFQLIVAAGGDGTTNEVINGMVATAREGKISSTLGLLATGSGSDFAYNVGMPTNLREACQRIARANTKIVDLTKFSLDGGNHRYFDNQLGIGFDGTVTVEAKKFKRLRGMALYLPVVIKSIFVSNKATQVTIEFDDQRLDLKTLQISIANGAREGGGFYMAPEARVDDGYLDLCILKEVSKLRMFSILPHFMKGTHTQLNEVHTFRARKITITSDDNLIAHYDGELLCTEGHKIECEIIPQALRVIY